MVEKSPNNMSEGLGGFHHSPLDLKTAGFLEKLTNDGIWSRSPSRAHGMKLKGGEPQTQGPGKVHPNTVERGKKCSILQCVSFDRGCAVLSWFGEKATEGKKTGPPLPRRRWVSVYAAGGDLLAL